MSSQECPGQPRNAPEGQQEPIYTYLRCVWKSVKIGQNPSTGNDRTRLQQSNLTLNAASAARRPSGLVMCCFSTPDGCDSGPERKSGFYRGRTRIYLPPCAYRCRSGYGFRCPPFHNPNGICIGKWARHVTGERRHNFGWLPSA
jgi:hypothetical protein